MTIVVGLVCGDRIYMSADSSISVGENQITACNQPKIIKEGTTMLGMSGSCHITDLLYGWDLPQYVGKKMMDPFIWMVIHFIPELKVHLVNLEKSDLELLVAVGGDLFYVCQDFSVHSPICGYSAIGTASEYSLGAMASLYHFQMEPEEMLELAMHAADSHCPHVTPPFVSLSIPVAGRQSTCIPASLTAPPATA